LSTSPNPALARGGLSGQLLLQIGRIELADAADDMICDESAADMKSAIRREGRSARRNPIDQDLIGLEVRGFDEDTDPVRRFHSVR